MQQVGRLAEPLSLNQRVVGSNPTAPTIVFNSLLLVGATGGCVLQATCKQLVPQFGADLDRVALSIDLARQQLNKTSPVVYVPKHRLSIQAARASVFDWPASLNRYQAD